MQLTMFNSDGEIKISSGYYKSNINLYDFETVRLEQKGNDIFIHVPIGEIKNIAKQLLLEALAQETEGFVTDFMLQLTQDVALRVQGE